MGQKISSGSEKSLLLTSKAVSALDGTSVYFTFKLPEV